MRWDPGWLWSGYCLFWIAWGLVFLVPLAIGLVLIWRKL
jgi:hypothetical protein